MASVLIEITDSDPNNVYTPDMKERKRQSILRMITTELDIYSAQADADDFIEHDMSSPAGDHVKEYLRYLNSEGFIHDYEVFTSPNLTVEAFILLHPNDVGSKVVKLSVV